MVTETVRRWGEVMSNFPPFRKWIFQYLMGLVAVIPVAFLLVPHLIFGVPTRPLRGLCLSAALAMLVFAPPFYFTAKHGRIKGDWKPACAVAGLAGGIMACIMLYYGASLGVLSSKVSHGAMIAILITLPLSMIGAYYFNSILFPKRFGRKNNPDGT